MYKAVSYFTCWGLYKLQRFDSIHEDFAFISKYSFCDLRNGEYDANTVKHHFTHMCVLLCEVLII